VQSVTTAADGGHEQPEQAIEPGDRAVIACMDAGELAQAVKLCASQHGLSIGRLCMAMLGDQGDAEDVVQETLLAAYAGFASWRREGSVRAWLSGIARKKSLKRLESRQRRGAGLCAIQAGEGMDHGAEELLALKQRAERARSLLEQIRPTEREALLLRYVGELDFSGVAQACETSEVTARKRVSRGLARLRELLSNAEEP
jgi:RNA polymerase sigma-70 factor, ECF subfamily